MKSSRCYCATRASASTKCRDGCSMSAPQADGSTITVQRLRTGLAILQATGGLMDGSI